MFHSILPTEHHFFPTEPSGMRTCPECKSEISGPQSSGKCRDLQQRTTRGQQKANKEHPGRNPNCEHVFEKPVAKKDKRNEELQKRNDELQKRNEELQAVVETLDSINNIFSTVPVPSLASREHSLAPLDDASPDSISDISKDFTFDDKMFDDENFDLLNDKPKQIVDKVAAQLRQELDTVRQKLDTISATIQQVLHQI